MDYPKFRAAEVITSFLLEDCAQVALQYFWFEESLKRHEFALVDYGPQRHSELGNLCLPNYSDSQSTTREFVTRNFVSKLTGSFMSMLDI